MPHVTKLFTSNTGECLACGATVTISGPSIGINSVTHVTASGSYILPNGVIVLADEDIEAYFNGELEFFDPDDNLQTE